MATKLPILPNSEITNIWIVISTKGCKQKKDKCGHICNTRTAVACTRNVSQTATSGHCEQPSGVKTIVPAQLLHTHVCSSVCVSTWHWLPSIFPSLGLTLTSTQRAPLKPHDSALEWNWNQNWVARHRKERRVHRHGNTSLLWRMELQGDALLLI